jgi:metallothionein
MADYGAGTVLTCSHGECDCRVRIESECNCPDANESYVCACGAPMIVVDAETAA